MADGDPRPSSAAGADQDWLVLYHRAFAEFGARALWHLRELDDPTPKDALVVARQLRIEGNLAARALAEQLEKMIGDDL